MTEANLSSFFSLHRPMSIHTPLPTATSISTFNSLLDTFESKPAPPQNAWANGNSAERRPEDVIFTLHNTIASLEGAGNGAQVAVAGSQISSPEGEMGEEEQDVRWEVLNQSESNAAAGESGVKHLDGIPGGHQVRMKTLEEIVGSFPPFKAPPAPVAFLQQPSAAQLAKQVAKARKTAGGGGKQAKKSYQTTITIHETTDADGVQKYEAERGPIVRVPSSAAAKQIRKEVEGARKAQTARTEQEIEEAVLAASEQEAATASASSSSPSPSSSREGEEQARGAARTRRTFMARRRVYISTLLAQRPRMLNKGVTIGRRSVIRAPATRGAEGRGRRVWAISVKRQRKLKMKKHKYKKLMKRTRNLRRRLDRN